MNYPSHYSSKVTVPLPTDDAIRRIVGDAYDSEKSLNVIKMFAGTEDMYPAVIGMVKSVFSAKGITAPMREMIILRAAKVLNSPYEWQANEKMAANAGLSTKEIAAAASDGPVDGIDPGYILLCRATEELLKTGTLPDETLSMLLQQFEVVIARKLILTISWFSLLSLFLNATRVPLETTDKIGKRTSPLEG